MASKLKFKRSSITTVGSSLLQGPSTLSLVPTFKMFLRVLLDINLIWFGYNARLSQWGGGILLVQMVSSCHRGLRGMGGGGQHPVIDTTV